MAGIRDLIPLIPPALLAGWTITSPTTSLHDVRIMGSTDPTYGTVGATRAPQWVPPNDGSPWAVIRVTGSKEPTYEPNRIRAQVSVDVYLALEDADTPLVIENYNDLLNAWADSFRQVVAENRRLGPGSYTIFPTIGDVRWDCQGYKEQEAMKLFGGEWYGAAFSTTLAASIVVNYQS